MSTIVSMVTPADKVAKTFAAAKIYTVDKLVKNGVDELQADKLGDVARMLKTTSLCRKSRPPMDFPC